MLSFIRLLGVDSSCSTLADGDRPRMSGFIFIFIYKTSNQVKKKSETNII